MRALEFRTGAGLSFTVLADRAMDVGLAEIDGVPLSFMTGWCTPPGLLLRARV